MICIAITGFFAKESTKVIEASEKFQLKDMIRPFGIKTFRQYLLIFWCCQMTMAVMSAMFFFYIDFYFCRDITLGGETNMVGTIGAALMFAMQIVALPFYLALIKRRSKTFVYIFGSVIWIVGALVLLAIPANSPPIVIYILASVLGFGISGPGLIPHAMLGDVVDVGTLKFGSSSAGAISGIANFVNTISQAIGLAVTMAILGAAGFIEQDLTAPKITSQPEFAQRAIIAVLALTPLIFMTFGIIICTRYKLNSQTHARVLKAVSGESSERDDLLKFL